MKIFVKDEEALEEMLIRKGYTKRGFAEVTNMSPSTLIYVSKGKRSPRADTAKRICEELQCDFDDLFIIEKE